MAAPPVSLIPYQISAGSVVKDTEFGVTIFNDGGVPITLSQIMLVNIDNALLNYGPGTILNPGGNATFSITILKTGQPVFPNAHARITFAGYDNLIYRIAGYRFSFVNLEHNWDVPLKERLEWLTDVMQTRDGHEFRRSLRRYPRHFLKLSHMLKNNRERITWEGIFYSSQGQSFGAIAWQDRARTNSAIAIGGSVATFVPHNGSGLAAYCAGFDYVLGQYVGFYFEKGSGQGKQWYLHQIIDFTSQGLMFDPPTDVAIPKGTIMAPIRMGHGPANFSANRLTTWHTSFEIDYRCLYNVQETYGQVDKAVARFTEQGTIGLPMYLGFYVLNHKPDYTQPVEWGYARTIYTQDFTLGAVRQVTTDSGPQNLERLDYLADTRDKIRDFFLFLDNIRGRWRPFWRLTTGDDDFILAYNASVGTNTLVVSAPDYNRFYSFTPSSRRDIAITDMRRTVLFTARIVGSSAAGVGLYVLELDKVLPFTVLAGVSQYHISFLRFARMATDVIEIEWIRHDVASFSLLIEDLQYGNATYTVLEDEVST